MSDFGPQITAARLYRKTSKSGATYFAGRMGMMKAALLKSKELAEDGSEIWHLVLSEAPTAQKPRSDRSSRRDVSARTVDERPFDDRIPFLAA